MKKLFALAILLFFLLGNTELHQVLLLPNLVADCLQHKKNTQATSLAQFLKQFWEEHYNNTTSTQTNNHVALPFLHHAHLNIIVYTPNTCPYQLPSITSNAQHSYLVTTLIPSQQSGSQSVFRPPIS